MAAVTKMLMNVAKGSALLAGGTILADNTLYNVPAGHAAVVFSYISGVQLDVQGEGTHFLIPFLNFPIVYDVRMRPMELGPSRTSSKDLQDVNVTLRVLFRPMREHLPEIHNTFGTAVGETFLPSIGNEVLKSVVAQFDAEELITQRSHVSHLIRRNLTRSAKQYRIVAEDVAITHLTFGTEFMRAVERKQVAEQEAEKQKFVVQIAEAEKRADVIRAEGEGMAAKLVSDAYEECGRAHLELRRIETAREIAETLAKSRNITYLPKGMNMLLSMPGQ